MEDLVKTINGELENISLWLKINKLSLNIKKTHFVMFQKGKWTMSIPDITINNQPIDKVEKTKFLCVVIDSKLSWKNHICLVAGKLSKSIGMIIKAREYLNRSALLTLYYSFVYPYYASAFRRRRHYVFGLSVRPSVRPKPEKRSFDLYMGPLVHPTNRNRFTACPSVRPSVCPSVRP